MAGHKGTQSETLPTPLLASEAIKHRSAAEPHSKYGQTKPAETLTQRNGVL